MLFPGIRVQACLYIDSGVPLDMKETLLVVMAEELPPRSIDQLRPGRLTNHTLFAAGRL